MNIQGWFPLGLIGLISLQSKGLSKSSPAPQLASINSLVLSLRYGSTPTSIHGCWKNHSFDNMDFVSKVVSLQSCVSAFQYARFVIGLSRFVIAFFPRSKHFKSSLLQSESTVILELKKIKSVTAFTFSPSICREEMGPNAMILSFFNVQF